MSFTSKLVTNLIETFSLLFLRQVSFDNLIDDPIEPYMDLDKSGIKNKEALVNEENRVDFAFEFGYNRDTKTI